MSVKLSASGFRGCKKVDIEFERIALLCGLNYSGKTSTLRAAGAAVTGLMLPPAMNKKDAPELVNDDTAGAQVSVVIDGGGMKASWPSCEAVSVGKPPFVSAFAAGMLALPDLDDKDRAKTLTGYLKSLPTIDDLRAHMLAMNLSENSVTHTWDNIERGGWDQTEAKAKEEALVAKRDWQKITGGTWGSAKAAGWTPAGWTTALENASAEDLAEKVKDTRLMVENAQRADAVSDDRMAQLRTLADTVPGLRHEFQTHKTAVYFARTKIQETERTLNGMARTAASMLVVCCPKCQAELNIIRTRDLAGEVFALQEAPKADPEEDARIEAERQPFLDELVLHNKVVVDGEAAMAALQIKINDGVDAEAKHQAATSQQPAGPGMTMDLEATKRELMAAETALAAYTAKTNADKLRARVTRFEGIAAAVGIEGVRKKKLAESVEAFNISMLAPICETARYGLVSLNDQLEIFYKHPAKRVRRFSLLSESEQMRVRVVLQVAMAKIDKSAMLIVDRADMLDVKGRNGMFDILRESELPALVGMTMSKRDLMPDLGANGFGAVWWMADGEAVPRAEALAS